MKKQQFKYEQYINLSYDDLLTYALYDLIKQGQVPTFENLVASVFSLFPKRFQLPGYPDWPDSSLVEKAWLRCRTDKSLMTGSKSRGFKLTDKGEALSIKVGQRIKLDPGKKTPVLKIKGDRKTQSGRVVKHVEESNAYKKYFPKEDIKDVSDFEFCDLLYTTLDTKPSLRRQSLAELKYHLNVYERIDLIKFLLICEEKFIHLLKDPIDSNYRGGMIRRKK